MAPENPTSLFPITIRRAFTVGRFFVLYGMVVSVLVSVALSFSAGPTSSTTFPFLLPIFSVLGSMGALVVFTNDRVKGVLEYLLAYGMSPRGIFGNFLATGLVLTSLILAVAVGGSLAVHLALGIPITLQLVELLAFYAIPMSYASTAFAASVGMFWTSLSSPRTGMNSPIGLVPFVGILPALGTLGLLTVLATRGVYSSNELVLVALGVVGVIALVVALLLSSTGRLLRREQLLSPL